MVAAVALVVVLVVVPAAVGLLVLAGPMTATLFGYGSFTARDVEMTQYGLMAYSWGLIGFSLVKVLAPGYFARQDTRTPVRVGLIALGVNMALNLLVVLPAHYAGFATPFVLLATSTCISAAVNAFLLWRGLRRSGVYMPRAGWGALIGRVAHPQSAHTRKQSFTKRGVDRGVHKSPGASDAGFTR